MVAKSLWTLHLEAIEQRLLNKRRLTDVEQATFDQLFDPSQLAAIARRHEQLEAEYPQRAVEAGLTELPRQSEKSGDLSSSRKQIQHRYAFHTKKADDLRKEIAALAEKLKWEEDMAASLVSGTMWDYNRLSDHDKQFWEQPAGPVVHIDDLPDHVEHIALVIWPDEPIAKRRAMLEALAPLIEAAREDEE